MDLKTLQNEVRKMNESMENPFKNSKELMMTIVEELGEVSTEIALIEKIGTKAQWKKEPSVDRLAEEMTHLLNLIVGVANHYEIDLNEVYSKKFQSK